MNKYIFIIATIAVFGTISIVGAVTKGDPFQAIWDAINNLQAQINNIQLTPGPQGPQGEQGPPGEPSWDETRIVVLENNIVNLNQTVNQLSDRMAQLEGRECFPGEVNTCSTGLLGICSGGTKTCNQNWTWGECVSVYQPSIELCDGIDNDCDGYIDNNCQAPLLHCLQNTDCYDLNPCTIDECSVNFSWNNTVWGDVDFIFEVWGDSTQYEYYSESGSYAYRPDDLLAQTFTPSVDHDITEIKLMIESFGSPGVIEIYIRETDSNGYPTGPLLAVGTIDGNDLATGWHSIQLDSTAHVIAGQKYAIVVNDRDSVPESGIHWASRGGGTLAGGEGFWTNGYAGACTNTPIPNCP